MITTNVLQRCFMVSCGDSQGTCFTIDVDNRQYIITVRHVVESFYSQRCPLVIHKNEEEYFRVPVEPVGCYIDEKCKNKDGVSVFAPKQQISVTYPLPPDRDGISMYDDVYILGFPYGVHGGVGPQSVDNLNAGFPLPVGKSGILSASYDEEGVMFLDAYNMSGFSGGPVVMKSSKKYKVVGIVKGYSSQEAPIYQVLGGEEKELPAYFWENTGLTFAYDIRHAVELIQSNPIGFDLSGV